MLRTRNITFLFFFFFFTININKCYLVVEIVVVITHLNFNALYSASTGYDITLFPATDPLQASGGPKCHTRATGSPASVSQRYRFWSSWHSTSIPSSSYIWSNDNKSPTCLRSIGLSTSVSLRFYIWSHDKCGPTSAG